MVAEYGLETVQEYMYHIRNNAEQSVRNLLRSVAQRIGTELEAVDYLDDGSPVRAHNDFQFVQFSNLFLFVLRFTFVLKLILSMEAPF